jgi:hypothetical protein
VFLSIEIFIFFKKYYKVNNIFPPFMGKGARRADRGGKVFSLKIYPPINLIDFYMANINAEVIQFITARGKI